MGIQSMAESYCRKFFIELWVGIGGTAHIGEELFNEILRYYMLPGRHYHVIAHIYKFLLLFRRKEFWSLTIRPDLMSFAIFFHDMIWQPGAPDNEERSGKEARRLLLAYAQKDPAFTRHGLSLFGEYELQVIYDQIIATRHDWIIVDPDQQLIADLDLAVGFGVDPVMCRELSALVRAESIDSEEEYARKQRGFLGMLYKRKPFYYREEVDKRFGQLTRQNLKHALEVFA